MTVKQLKAKLEDYPDDAVIVLRHHNTGVYCRAGTTMSATRTHYSNAVLYDKSGTYPKSTGFTVLIK